MRQDKGIKEQFIITASKLFEEKGYYAVGINEILRESKAPKGSLYYYFPNGKEELAIESIRYAKMKIKNHIKDTFMQCGSFIEGLEKNLLCMADLVDTEKKLRDISIGLIALETYSSSPNLRKECHLVFETIINFYIEELVKSGLNKQKALEIATLIESLTEGAITLSLTAGEGTPLRIAAKNIKYLVMQ